MTTQAAGTNATFYPNDWAISPSAPQDVPKGLAMRWLLTHLRSSWSPGDEQALSGNRLEESPRRELPPAKPLDAALRPEVASLEWWMDLNA